MFPGWQPHPGARPSTQVPFWRIPRPGMRWRERGREWRQLVSVVEEYFSSPRMCVELWPTSLKISRTASSTHTQHFSVGCLGAGCWALGREVGWSRRPARMVSQVELGSWASWTQAPLAPRARYLGDSSLREKPGVVRSPLDCGPLPQGWGFTVTAFQPLILLWGFPSLAQSVGVAHFGFLSGEIVLCVLGG